MRLIWKMPPLCDGSPPKVGARPSPRLAATTRLRRALSSSAVGGFASLPGAAGADAARARRFASMYDVRSPSAGDGAGTAVDCDVGGGDRVSGAGRWSAMTGGVARCTAGRRARRGGDAGARSAGGDGAAGGEREGRLA